MKRTNTSAFWQKVKFKYKVFILNENTLEEVFSFRLSLWSGFWVLFAFAVFLISLTSVVIINTPIRNYLPGYMDTEIRQEMIANALKTDSLEQLLQVQTQYIESTAAILKGTSPIAKTAQPDTTVAKGVELKKSKTMEKFMRDYEKQEKANGH
jgi:hypothetical protein